MSVSDRSLPSGDGVPGLDGLLNGLPGGSGQFVPGGTSTHSLKPPASPRQLSGACELYRGRACGPHLANRTVFVAAGDSQARGEQRLAAALRVIRASADLSQVHRHRGDLFCLSRH